MTSVRLFTQLCFLAFPLAALARPVVPPPLRVYVAGLGPSHVDLAWGRASGGAGENTIGRGAAGSGSAMVEIGTQKQTTDRSWIRIEGLAPDTDYKYSVAIGGSQIAAGTIRTWPEKADSLTFFVIGDFGNGSKEQYALAQRMDEERIRLQQSGHPVRFVLSTGDNIYGKLSASGNKDRDWEKKFFAPYASTLAAIPFRAVLGNHDGNESENAGDLDVCLDNFFMPGRWYNFDFGGLAEFIALDSTRSNATGGPTAPAFAADGEQSKWLRGVLAKPGSAKWRIAWMHHPMFTAGPRHGAFLGDSRHWYELFQKSGVQVVFAGHEHNFQVSERSAATGGMQFVVSGAGGELRSKSVRKKMAAAHIAAWAPQRHFISVTIDAYGMSIVPIGVEPDVHMLDAAGSGVAAPIRVPPPAPRMENTQRSANRSRTRANLNQKQKRQKSVFRAESTWGQHDSLQGSFARHICREQDFHEIASLDFDGLRHIAGRATAGGAAGSGILHRY